MWMIGVCLLAIVANIPPGGAVLFPLDDTSLNLLTEQVLVSITTTLEGDFELLEQKQETFKAMNQTCNTEILVDQNACLQCRNEHLEECQTTDMEVEEKTKAIEILITLLIDPTQLYRETVKKVEEKLVTAVKRLGDKAKSFVKAVDKAAHKIGTKLKQGFEEISDGIKDAAKKLGKGIEKTISKVADNVKSGLKGIEKTVKTGVSKATDAVKSTVKGAARLVRSAARTVSSAVRRVARYVRFRARFRMGKRKRSASACIMECDSCLPFEENGETAVRMICGDEFLDLGEEIKLRLNRLSKVVSAIFDEDKPMISKIEYDPTSIEMVKFRPQYNNVSITANIDGEYVTYQSCVPYQLMDIPDTAAQWAAEYMKKYE